MNVHICKHFQLVCRGARTRSSFHIVYFIVTDAHWCCQFKWFRNEEEKRKSFSVLSHVCQRHYLCCVQCFVHISHVFMTFISLLLFISHSHLLSPSLLVTSFSILIHYFHSSVSFLFSTAVYSIRTHSQTVRNTNTLTQRVRDRTILAFSVSCCVERVKIASVANEYE